MLEGAWISRSWSHWLMETSWEKCMNIGPKVVGSSCSQRADMSMLRVPFKRVRFGYGAALFLF